MSMHKQAKSKLRLNSLVFLFFCLTTLFKSFFRQEANSVNLFFAGFFQQHQVCSKTVVNSCDDCIRSGPYCVWCKQLVKGKHYATSSNCLFEAHGNDFGNLATTSPGFNNRCLRKTGRTVSKIKHCLSNLNPL